MSNSRKLRQLTLPLVAVENPPPHGHVVISVLEGAAEHPPTQEEAEVIADRTEEERARKQRTFLSAQQKLNICASIAATQLYNATARHEHREKVLHKYNISETTLKMILSQREKWQELVRLGRGTVKQVHPPLKHKAVYDAGIEIVKMLRDSHQGVTKDLMFRYFAETSPAFTELGERGKRQAQKKKKPEEKSEQINEHEMVQQTILNPLETKFIMKDETKDASALLPSSRRGFGKVIESPSPPRVLCQRHCQFSRKLFLQSFDNEFLLSNCVNEKLKRKRHTNVPPSPRGGDPHPCPLRRPPGDAVVHVRLEPQRSLVDSADSSMQLEWCCM